MISDFDIIPLLRRTGIVDRGEVAAAIKFSELEALVCSSMLFTSSLPKLSVASIDMFEVSTVGCVGCGGAYWPCSSGSETMD